MLKVGILGSTGRVGSLLIDDLENNENMQVGSVHVFDELKKALPKDAVVTNDMKTMLAIVMLWLIFQLQKQQKNY